MIDEVILLRHGRTAYNLVHRLQGQVDVPLDIVGQWQVDQAGLELAQRYYWAKPANIAHHPDLLFQPGPGAAERSDISEYKDAPVARRAMKVISSDLCRAAQTAHAFADILGLPVTLDARLRERDFGKWEGLTRPEIQQMDAEAYASWKAHTGGEQAYGVETRTAVGRRGAAALNALLDEHVDDGMKTTLLVASHGSFIAATLETLLGLDPEQDLLGNIPNAYWSRLSTRRNDDGTWRWRLEEFNQGPTMAKYVDWGNGPEELHNSRMGRFVPLS